MKILLRSLREETTCRERDCSVDGQWGAWSNWERCDQTCGGGIQTRSRLCDDPPPDDDGLYCVGGSGVESRVCAKNKCPLDGSWGEWLGWSYCSVSCGSG